jgi:hypothetical protein
LLFALPGLTSPLLSGVAVDRSTAATLARRLARSRPWTPLVDALVLALVGRQASAHVLAELERTREIAWKHPFATPDEVAAEHC